jgi:exopolyphosphatase / guanosine-5'-triphosphate,3'-diphosphate pyrophosphatase
MLRTGPAVPLHLPDMADRPPFPCFGALDVGSSSIRFTIASVDPEGIIRERVSRRYPIRLGRGAFSSGALEPGSIRAAVEVCLEFRGAIDRFGVVAYRAVATSAVRDATNGNELISAVRSAADVELETIDGIEEAALIWRGVSRKLPRPAATWLLADVGGGSTEITLVDGGTAIWSRSFPLGTVRTLESLPRGAEAPLDDIRERVGKTIGKLDLPPVASGRTIQGIVLTGGNAEVAAGLASGRRSRRQGAEISLAQLSRIREDLARFTPAERVERMGLRPDRADVILPAIVIFEALAEAVPCERFFIPGSGVREGILLGLAGVGDP